jgi:mannose-6-phosphate isomerase-like protein (cupin superfamily)
MERISITEKFARFAEQWQPKIIAELNGQEVKLVKVQGTFPWHHHDDADELFLVWRGRFRVEFRDRIVELGPGELVTVPRGVEHRTAADQEAEVILLEPAGILNTGTVVDEKYSAPTGVRI